MTTEKCELFLEKLLHSIDMGQYISENILPAGFENFISEKFDNELTSSNLNRLNCLNYIHGLLQKSSCNHKTESFAGEAYMQFKDSLLADSEKLKTLSKNAGSEHMLHLYQWSQIISFALAFKPDCILEIGGMGKRTSLMLNYILEKSGAKQGVPKNFTGKEKNLIYFCSDKIKNMEYLLSNVLPLIKDTVHSVIFHGYSNLLLTEENSRSYKNSAFVYNNISSSNANSPLLFDFVSRNNLTLFSADSSLQTYKKNIEMLDGQLFSTSANWVWFTLNEKTDSKIYFP